MPTPLSSRAIFCGAREYTTVLRTASSRWLHRPKPDRCSGPPKRRRRGRSAVAGPRGRRQTVAMIVVFDTTVLFTDVHASRPLTEQVLRRALEEDWEVVIPRVVVEEAVRQYPIRLAELLAASQREIKKFRTTFQAFGMNPPTVPDVDVDALIEAYEPALREVLSQDPCAIAETPARERTGWYMGGYQAGAVQGGRNRDVRRLRMADRAELGAPGLRRARLREQHRFRRPERHDPASP